MPLVTRRHESGLLLAESHVDSGGEAGLRRALKRMDDRLRLLSPPAVLPGTPTGYWRVVRVLSDDQPAVPVVTWMDTYGEPLPLSTGLLDMVQSHRRDGRGQAPTADERNSALEAAVKRERRDQMDALHDEYEPYLERGRVGVSLGGRNRKPYWLRRYRGGER